MDLFKTLIFTSLLHFLFMSCTNEKKTTPRNHDEKSKSDIHNIKELDLQHRDSLSLSLDTAEEITPYNFHENFSIHDKKNNESHNINLLSWGNVEMPNLVILLSDDNNLKRSHIVKLEGKLAKHWIRDLNRDGDPELILFSMYSENNTGNLKILEFDDQLGMKIFQLREVEITEHQGYQGHDNFVLHHDTIKRTFPKYLPRDPKCCPTGKIQSINYLWGMNDYFELIDKQ